MNIILITYFITFYFLLKDISSDEHIKSTHKSSTKVTILTDRNDKKLSELSESSS